MKLVIQIPCYNEEKTLPLVLRELPKKIISITKIEIQIIDDGSTDKTIEVAKDFRVDRIIKHKKNLGLGQAFKHGMIVALREGADILVNTDGDNQYPSKYIPALVKPIIEGKADIVVGDRRPWKIKHFPFYKRIFQYVGNKIVGNIMKSNVPDNVSGFRAYSREAMLKLNIVTRFSYVLDTLMQASKKGLKVLSYPIETNKPTRKSRLFKNIFQHMKKSGANILRLYSVYEPFKTFLCLSAILVLPALVFIIRFLFYYYSGDGAGHIQSLVIAAILFISGVLMFALGVIGDLIKTNRELVEEGLYLKKKVILNGKKPVKF